MDSRDAGSSPSLSDGGRSDGHPDALVNNSNQFHDDSAYDHFDAIVNNSNQNGQQKRRIKRKAKASSQKIRDHFENATFDIIWAACLISIPLLTLSAVFLGLVFYLQVSDSIGDSANNTVIEAISLLNTNQTLDGAYLVDIDSTRLITVASFTSTLISFLPPWIMVLTSYLLSSRYMRASQSNRTKALPTPFQLRLIIELYMGGIGALWDWMLYRLARGKKARSNAFMDLGAICLIAAILFGILIILADTWLHVTTTTVQLQENIRLPLGSADQFSRIITPRCLKIDVGTPFCTIKDTQGLNVEEGRIRDQIEAYKTFFGISTENQVLDVEHQGQQYSFLASADLPEDVTFDASTFAINTRCEPISRACNLHTYEYCPYPCISHQFSVVDLIFNCSSALQDNLVRPSNTTYFYSSTSESHFFLQYFTNSNLTRRASTLPLYIRTGSQPPSFMNNMPAIFAVGAKVQGDSRLNTDPEVVPYPYAQDKSSFLLRCFSSVVEMTYSFAHGSARVLKVSPANQTVIAAIINPWLEQHQGSTLDSSIQRAGLHQTVQEVADAFAKSYSSTVLGLAVGAVDPAPALRESHLTTRQVTRLPMAPFYTLLALNCVYAVLGAILAISALLTGPRRVKPVQARLSITGIVAALFEGDLATHPVHRTSELFIENNAVIGASGSQRVAIAQTVAGGWGFRKVIRSSGSIP